MSRLIICANCSEEQEISFYNFFILNGFSGVKCRSCEHRIKVHYSIKSIIALILPALCLIALEGYDFDLGLRDPITSTFIVGIMFLLVEFFVLYVILKKSKVY